MARAGDVEERLELLVSELATNAVLHARSQFVVRVRRSTGKVLVEVDDLSDELPVRKRYGPAAPTGRGLLLLDAIADRWGVRRRNRGKTVWFELSEEPTG